VEIAAAAGNGNWEAWVAEQVRLRGPLLFRLAHEILKDPARAEDVCQDVVVKALQMRSSIREPQALKGWLARVVINQSLIIRRREQCEQRVRQAMVQRAGSNEAASVPTDLRESLESAVQELPQPTQAVVVLRLMQGMSGNQVKDLLGMSASDVSRKLHEGMDYLRGRLGEAHGPE
jgi:RNA polymerase sigma-70 factor, ECF subfamily